MKAPLPRRAYLGMLLGSSAEKDGLPVRAVLPRSSAELAGVRAGDVLTHLDRNPVVDLIETRRLLRAFFPGDPLVLGIRRGTGSLVLDTEVVPLPEERYEGARVELGQVDVAGVSLRTVSVVPLGTGPFAVVYFLPGAHWASEEYPLEPEHPVPSLLGALARAGIGSVRVERSGVGDSSGPSCTRVDFETELSGYRAGLDYVLARPWAASGRVFLVAHSLGAMVAPLLAPGTSLAGVAVYAAGALPISRALEDALVRHGALSGERVPSPRTERIRELIRAVVCGGETPAAVFAERPDLAAEAPSHFTRDQAYGRIASFYHQLERAPVEEAYRRLGAPALFVHGSRDWITTAADSEALAGYVGAGARAVEIPGADHFMSDAVEGAPPRLCPDVRDAVVDWLRDRITDVGSS